jgi:hypothetical protein
MLHDNIFFVGFRGLPAGAENGERGYMLTFVIAYIRVSTKNKNKQYMFSALNIFQAYHYLLAVLFLKI